MYHYASYGMSHALLISRSTLLRILIGLLGVTKLRKHCGSNTFGGGYLPMQKKKLAIFRVLKLSTKLSIASSFRWLFGNSKRNHAFFRICRPKIWWGGKIAGPKRQNLTKIQPSFQRKKQILKGGTVAICGQGSRQSSFFPAKSDFRQGFRLSSM
jgi:hypothetical protein